MKHVSVNKNIIFNILKSFMGIVFPIISFPYAARVLGVEKIGLVNYCNTIIGYFILLSGLGINIYATREGVKYRDSKELLSRFTKEILLINILSTLTSYAILFVLVVCTDLRKNAVLLCICSMSIVFTTFQIEWLFQIMEQFTYISIRSIVFQAVSFIILVIFVKNPNDYLIYAIINVFASCGNFWLNIIKSCQYVDWKLRCRLTPQKHIKPILVIFGISVSASIYLNLDIVMIGSIRNTTEVGLYSSGVRLVTVIKTLLSSVSMALLPRLSYLKKNKFEQEYKDYILKYSNYLFMIAIPASVGIIILRKEIIILFAGAAFIDAAFICCILAINMIFSVIDGMLYNQLFLPANKEHCACVATVCGAICNLILNIIFIPRYGYIAASITTLVSEIIVFGLLISFGKKIFDVSMMFKYVPHYILASVSIYIIGAIGNRYITNIWVKIVFIVILSVLAYFEALFMLKNKYIYEVYSVIRQRIKNMI